MPPDQTYRRRKSASKAFFPWPGFFLLNQNLPDRLLSLQAHPFYRSHLSCQSIYRPCDRQNIVQDQCPAAVHRAPLSSLQIGRSVKVVSLEGGHRYCRWLNDFLVLVRSESADKQVMWAMQLSGNAVEAPGKPGKKPCGACKRRTVWRLSNPPEQN